MTRKQKPGDEILPFPWEPDPNDFMARFAARSEYEPPPQSSPPTGGNPCPGGPAGQSPAADLRPRADA